jgi:hypothetical protein
MFHVSRSELLDFCSWCVWIVAETRSGLFLSYQIKRSMFPSFNRS